MEKLMYFIKLRDGRNIFCKDFKHRKDTSTVFKQYIEIHTPIRDLSIRRKDEIRNDWGKAKANDTTGYIDDLIVYSRTELQRAIFQGYHLDDDYAKRVREGEVRRAIEKHGKAEQEAIAMGKSLHEKTLEEWKREMRRSGMMVSSPMYRESTFQYAGLMDQVVKAKTWCDPDDIVNNDNGTPPAW